MCGQRARKLMPGKACVRRGDVGGGGESISSGKSFQICSRTPGFRGTPTRKRGGGAGPEEESLSIAILPIRRWRRGSSSI